MRPKIIERGLQHHDRDTRDRLRQCLIAPLACARSAGIALWSPPTSSSVADEKHVGSLLLSTPARDPPVSDCSARLRSQCSMARSARCDVRWVAAVFVGADGPEKRCSAISSCRSAARTSRARIALGRRLLRHRSPTKSASAHSCVHCSLRSLRLALVSSCLPHSLADEKACLLAHSSRTAARQPGSARRRAIRCLIASAPLRRGSRVQPADLYEFCGILLGLA